MCTCQFRQKCIHFVPKLLFFPHKKCILHMKHLLFIFSLCKRENIEYPHKRTKSQKFYFYKDLKRKNVDQSYIAANTAEIST